MTISDISDILRMYSEITERKEDKTMQNIMTLLFYIIVTSVLLIAAIVLSDYTSITEKLLKLFMED